MPSTLPDPIPQILKSRPDWASGVASTAGRKELITHWVGAAIMNVLGLPVGWIALFGDRDLPVYLQVVLPSFTLLGLLILFVAVRESLRWRRFGRLEMTLDPLPGSIGGHVGGSLELPLHQAAGSDCRVMLMCIRDRLVKTKDGSSRSESVEWARETLPDLGRSGSGVRLRYTFEVPEGLPPSEEPSDDYHKWVIRVQADLPGADLDQVFEVPALLVDPPLQAREPALAEATAAEALELSPRVVRVHRSRGGLTLYFPAGRGGLGGIMLLIFGAVFAGAGVFAFVTTADIGADGVIGGVTVVFGGFFLLVFGGVGALMMLLGLYSLVNSLVVEIRNGKVTARRSFFVPFSRTARFDEIQRIEMDVHSRVGQGAKSSSHVRIRGIVRGGRRISLGDDVPLGRQSEILAALLEEAIGVPVETVKRSRLRVPA
ncbi:MAG: hypothetical protein IID07_00165 [Gemmatimonadetes bacterium]|nr:hypothetical protein [Gemmatimonadota bacterium]